MYKNPNRQNKSETRNHYTSWEDLLIPVSEKSRLSLADKAFQILREAIINGELRPSQRIVEYEIAQRLGMSRTPVREAIKRLEEQEYLYVVSRNRLIVTDHSLTQIKDLYEVREALESMAVRLACQQATEEQSDKVEHYHKLSLKVIPNENRDPSRFIELNVAFHSELWSTCNNKLLLRLMKTYGMDQFFYTRLTRTFTDGDWQVAAIQHGRILKAVRQRNVNLADKVTREHVLASKKIALKRLG